MYYLKTHNGFKSFVETEKGETTEVDEKYYQQAKRLASKNK